MNSLTYLSRQFDVLASARTVPNTPTSEFPLTSSSFSPLPPFDDSGSLSTKWTLKSLVALPPPPRRSNSSPGRIGRSKPTSSNTPSSPSVSKHARRPSQRTFVRPKSPSQAQSVFRRMFFVRTLVLVWHTMCATARSLSETLRPGLWHTPSNVHTSSHSLRVEEVEKGSTDGGADSSSPLSQKSSPCLSPPTPPTLPHPPPAIRSSTELPALSATPVLSQYPDVPTNIRSSLQNISQSLFPHPLASSITMAPSAEDPQTRTPSPSLQTAAGLPIAPRKTPFHLPKTLVLDLDETLIHSTSRPFNASESGSGLLGFSFGRRNKNAHTVEVNLGGRTTLYHVYKRPFVDFFLRKVSAWYTLVIFTASMQEYADPVIDWLDAGTGMLSRRLFRESCTQLPNGSYSKDLSVVEQDLARVCLIDNSPICYSINETNGIPIEGWTHDPHDEALLDLLPVLDSLRFTSDVRRVLGVRGFT